MKAARIHRFGGAEVIAIDNVPTPAPGAGEVRIRVHASSINPVDYKIRQGGFLPDDKLPITLGRDAAGIVDQIGPSVTACKPGDAVMAMLPQDVGGNAEYVVLPAALCAPKPLHLEQDAAAALGLAAITAWQGLFDHGGLHSGQRVLIHGAAGGVGHLAVQFAHARGAEVFATCSAADLDFVRGIGAAQAIDFKAERFEDRVRDVDIVFDLVNGETQDRSWAVLKRGGVLVSTLKEPDQQKARQHGARGVLYMAKPNGAQLTEIGQLADTGKVVPTVTRVLPLSAVADAHRLLEHEHPRGKVVLHVG